MIGQRRFLGAGMQCGVTLRRLYRLGVLLGLVVGERCHRDGTARVGRIRVIPVDDLEPRRGIAIFSGAEQGIALTVNQVRRLGIGLNLRIPIEGTTAQKGNAGQNSEYTGYFCEAVFHCQFQIKPGIKLLLLHEQEAKPGKRCPVCCANTALVYSCTVEAIGLSALEHADCVDFLPQT